MPRFPPLAAAVAGSGVRLAGLCMVLGRGPCVPTTLCACMQAVCSPACVHAAHHATERRNASALLALPRCWEAVPASAPDLAQPAALAPRAAHPLPSPSPPSVDVCGSGSATVTALAARCCCSTRWRCAARRTARWSTSLTGGVRVHAGWCVCGRCVRAFVRRACMGGVVGMVCVWGGMLTHVPVGKALW